MTRLAVGVDGGGTHTRAVVVDDQGRELGRAQGRGAVADAQNPVAAAQAVAAVVTDAVSTVGVALPVDALWAGLSGAGREAARGAVSLELSRVGLARSVQVSTDVGVAFHDAFGKGPGVLLIAGTGSIAWGRGEDGREGRVGGWGHHIGDEGSGYAIGREALRAVARQADGRAPRTRLRVAVLDALELPDPDALVPWASGASKAEVAALAPVVAAAAGAGDGEAAAILRNAVDDLEGHVLAILENLGPWTQPPDVALAGGLLRPGRALREPLVEALGRHRLHVVERELDPARGAAELARTLLT